MQKDMTIKNEALLNLSNAKNDKDLLNSLYISEQITDKDEKDEIRLLTLDLLEEYDGTFLTGESFNPINIMKKKGFEIDANKDLDFLTFLNRTRTPTLEENLFALWHMQQQDGTNAPKENKKNSDMVKTASEKLKSGAKIAIKKLEEVMTPVPMQDARKIKLFKNVKEREKTN